MFDFVDIFTSNLVFFADTAGAIKTVRDYVLPTAKILSGIASLACAFFLTHAGYIYMTSSGKPDRMEYAKSIAKKAVIGLVIVLAAVTIVSILMVHIKRCKIQTTQTYRTCKPLHPSQKTTV